MAKINKVGHVVLGVRDPQRSIKFYTEALGMELVNVLEEMQMAFLSFGERDHDIAVIKVPDDQPVGSSGLAHTALEIEGGQEQLRELYQRLKSCAQRMPSSSCMMLVLQQMSCNRWTWKRLPGKIHNLYLIEESNMPRIN